MAAVAGVVEKEVTLGKEIGEQFVFFPLARSPAASAQTAILVLAMVCIRTSLANRFHLTFNGGGITRPGAPPPIR